ncbi:MAG: EamA family transporter [Nitrososphaeria archaeon]
MEISWSALGILTLLLYTTGDMLIKRPSERIGFLTTSLITSLSSALTVFLLLRLTDEPLGPFKFLSAVEAGAFMGAGTLLVLKSLEIEQVSDTMAFVAISYAVPVIFGAVVLKEMMSVLQLSGALLTFAGSFAVAFKNVKFNWSLFPAMLGNVFWGLQFVAFSYAVSQGDVLAPAFVASLVGLATVAAYGLASRGLKKPDSSAALALLAGAALGLGLISALYIVSMKSMSLGFTVVAAEPALVTLLGRLVYRDRINVVQVVGIFIASIGILLLTV